MNKTDSKRLQKIAAKLDSLINELGDFEDKQRKIYDGLSEKKQDTDKGHSLGNAIDCIIDAVNDMGSAYDNLNLALNE